MAVQMERNTNSIYSKPKAKACETKLLPKTNGDEALRYKSYLIDVVLDVGLL
jgi:hypothetical protein